MGSQTSPDQDEQEERLPNSPLQGPELLISAAEHARGQASLGRDVDNDLQGSPPREPKSDGGGSPAPGQSMVPEPGGRSKRSAAVAGVAAAAAAVAAAAAAVAAAAAEPAAESEHLEEKPQPAEPDPPLQAQPQQQQQQQQQQMQEDAEQEQEEQQAAAQGGSNGGGGDMGAAAKGRGGPKPKLPRPEGVQPCPRCESQDTKFCYYNNYNIKQPRYFCRACQRYWTAGGALRDVPVGAGRRKSKASKPDGMPSQSTAAGAMLPPPPPDPTAIVANIMASMPEAVLSQMPPLGGLGGPLDPAGAALAAYRHQLPGGDEHKKRTLAMLQGMPPGMQPLAGGMPPQMGDAGLAMVGGVGMIPPDLGGPGAKLPVGGPLGMAASSLLGGREPGGDVGPDGVAGLLGGPKVPNGLGAILPSGAGSSLPLSEDDGSVDGRRTRMKVGGGSSLSPGGGAAGGMGAAGMLPSGGLSALASAAGGAAGAAGLLAAAAGGRGAVPGLSPQSAPIVPPAPPAGLFGGAARYGADGGLGAAHHLGTAGPLSSEFFAMPAAHAPHMQQHQVAAAAMHAQLLQLQASAAAPHMAAPYGIGGMWPYGGLAPFGGPQPPWPGAHPAAAASLARYPAPGFGMPPTGAAAGAAPGLGLGLGGPLGAAPHPASSMLSTVDMAQALAQVPASCGPAAIAPTQLPAWPGRLGTDLGGPAGGWGAMPGMGGALGHSALAASALQHHPGMGGPLGGPSGLPGDFGGLGMSMVPTSAAPSGSLMAAAAASGLGPSEDAGVPA